jgi:hypothetical protein
MTEIRIKEEISNSLEMTREISAKIRLDVSNDVNNAVSVIQVVIVR